MRPQRLAFARWLALACGLAIGIVAVAAWAFWAALEPAGREALRPIVAGSAGLLVVLLFFLPFVLGALLKRIYDAYPAAALRLADEVRIIRTANPGHRVTPAGGAALRELAAAINDLAGAHSALRHDVQARVEESGLGLAQEKNRLAALMSELAQSVLVCNADGRILLYNARATQLLAADEAGRTPVGLGRSVFGLLDKSAVAHALDKLHHRIAQGSVDPVAHFVAARAGRLLRTQMAPVLDAARAIDGFVLLLEDITRSVELDSRRNAVLQQLTEGTRSSLANIRAAAETLQLHPEMDGARRRRFTDVISEESARLSQQLELALARGGEVLHTPWPMEDMVAGDLVAALQRNFEVGLGVTAHVEPGHERAWLSVDSHALVQALTHLIGRVHSAFGTRSVALALEGGERFVRLWLRWSGPPLEPALLHAWEAEPIAMGGDGHVATLREVIERHGAELWCRAEPTAGSNRLCVQLPSAHGGRDSAAVAAAPARPVYYDFDLFGRPLPMAELDDSMLSALSYTAFDTETTGLSPSDGDEIVSVGAVRIVNGRLLEHECFDQLVNPRRAISKASQRVHGLSADMLADQPTIDQVLPAFHRFAEDTVLVGHNVAFDMRFLALKEASAGVRFAQPVLDTLLLSALVHPAHADSEHQLECIAARLGIAVIGRHTALGDAIVTGEVFLKLIPLLAERGIRTLRDAREASGTTPYAKVEY